MKKSRIQQWLMVVAIIALPLSSFAQQGPKGPGNGQGPRGQRFEERGDRMMEKIPNLTEDQREQMKAVRISSQEELLPIRNSINEKEAALITLQTAKSADMKAIYKVIDELSAERAKIQKINAKSHQEIRKILTDEQRLAFDIKFQEKGKGLEPDQRKGGGPGNGGRNGNRGK